MVRIILYIVYGVLVVIFNNNQLNFIQQKKKLKKSFSSRTAKLLTERAGQFFRKFKVNFFKENFYKIINSFKN